MYINLNVSTPICKELQEKMSGLTIDDAFKLFDEGIYCIFEDGKIAYLTNNPDKI